MDRKELYQNVRKAFRLAYEVQDSIIEMVEYIRTRIRSTACAGGQLFSAPIETCKPELDEGVNQKIGSDSWGKQGNWKYFPTFMYMYYFECKPAETQKCCFAIIQVIDDGIAKPLNEKHTTLSTASLKNPADSESYLLFSFSIWKDHDFIWFYRNEERNELSNTETEIFRIGETIKSNGYKPYVVSNDASTFVVTRINLESIWSKQETDHFLQDFAKLVHERTGYQILIEDPEE